MAIMYLYKGNFTCPKEQISLYLSVLKQYIYSYSFKYSMKPDINSIVNSADPDRLASSEASRSGSTLFSIHVSL